MRFFVLGATGMAGHMVALYLHDKGYDVVGSYRRESITTEYLEKAGVKLVKLDARDSRMLSMAIRDNRPDIIVNCIGLLKSACDKAPDDAILLNSYLPHHLASIVAESSSRVIQISTDCVFAGNSGPYAECSVPDATSLYAVTKALGELHDDHNLTLRQSIVGPDPDSKGIGLLNWFMQQTESVTGWTKAIWTGLTTLELAKAVEACACEGATGLINMVPKQSGVSKCWLLNIFNEFLRSDPVEVRAVDGLNADKSLIRTNYECSFEPLSYEEQIRELSIWIKEHPGLYPY